MKKVLKFTAALAVAFSLSACFFHGPHGGPGGGGHGGPGGHHGGPHGGPSGGMHAPR